MIKKLRNLLRYYYGTAETQGVMGSINTLGWFVFGYLQAIPQGEILWGWLHDYIAHYYSDKRSLGWVSIISEHEDVEKRVETGLRLLEMFFDDLENKGYPDFEPPHFQIGGVYLYNLDVKEYVALILSYDSGYYLVAFPKGTVQKVRNMTGGDILNRQLYRIAWIPCCRMLPPSKMHLIDHVTITKDMSLLPLVRLHEMNCETEEIWRHKRMNRNDKPCMSTIRGYLGMHPFDEARESED
ncbi:MAG: hypothetical protein ILP12_03575 [Lachnospiraceae bacterium]|nr:hypothetical protein [Lachnospiraceae bacterium]